jgi:hypothetical protein
MTLRDLVKMAQRALNKAGANPPFNESGEFGARTAAELEKWDIEIVLKKKASPIKPLPIDGEAPWLDDAKKHSGKRETDSAFNRYLSAFWKIVGLPNYKTIVGTSFAWCGLLVAASLYNVGLPWQKDGAAARNLAKYGVAIDWKQDGIPRGAIVHINHNANCSSGSSNHVGMADGDCAPQDLKGGAINIYGGNQSNAAKVSAFPVGNICAVRWPTEPKPAKVLTSKGCKGTPGGDSTR